MSRDDLTTAIGPDAIHGDPAGARQLRVRDVTEPWAREALSKEPACRSDGRYVLEAIEDFARVFAENPPSHLDAPVWEVPEGLILVDRNHRTCGLYVARLNVELRLHAIGPPPPSSPEALSEPKRLPGDIRR